MMGARALRRALGALTAATLLSGCSLVFGLDPDLLDGGPDGGFDAGEAGMCPQQFEGDCEDGVDNDCDGLIDCFDLDCSSDLLRCCGGRSLMLSEDWSPVPTPTGWRALPSGSEGSFARADHRGMPYLSDFGGGEPHALWQELCIPASTGVSIEAWLRLSPERGPTCTACDDYAAVVLTSAQDLAPGEGLLDELAIRLRADGQLTVTQAGAPLGASPAWQIEGDLGVRVELDLSPGVDPDTQTAVIYADLRLVPEAGEPLNTRSVSHYPFILARELVGRSGGCLEGGGLFLAVEGAGHEAWAGRLSVYRNECANPEVFTRLPEGPIEIDSETLFPNETLERGRWSRGGIGAPSLVSFRLSEGERPRYNLLVDASNLPRSNETLSPFGFSIGGAYSSGVTGWMDFTVGGRSVLVGACPPACPSGAEGCGPVPSACDTEAPPTREPGAVAVPRADGVLPETAGLALAYARARGVSLDDIEVYDIYTTQTDEDGRPASTPTEPALRPEDILTEDCISLRDPSLVPRGRDVREGYWLLFTCVREGPDQIWAKLLGMWLAPTERDPVRLLSSSDLGSYAAGGVSAPEPVTIFEDPSGERMTYRVWFLARDASGSTSVGFAQSRVLGVDDQSFPPLVPYGANPVLTADAEILGECPEEGCRLTGLSAVQRLDQPNRVRFLFARTLNRPGAPAHVLTPLEQIWPLF